MFFLIAKIRIVKHLGRDVFSMGIPKVPLLMEEIVTFQIRNQELSGWMYTFDVYILSIISHNYQGYVYIILYPYISVYKYVHSFLNKYISMNDKLYIYIHMYIHIEIFI